MSSAKNVSVKGSKVRKSKKTIYNVIKAMPAKPHKPSTFVDRKLRDRIIIVTVGSILAVNAGWLNAVAIETTSVAVSHVTGTLSVISMDIIDGQWDDLSFRCVTLFSFTFGAFVSGILIPGQSFHLSRFYYRAIGLEACCIVVAFVAFPNHYIFNAFLAMSCGIQNAITTRYSGNILRTTHHSGTLTDIGVIIGHFCGGNHTDTWKLSVLIPLFLSFVFGSGCGLLVSRKLGANSLLVNVSIIIVLALGDAIVMLRKGSKLIDKEEEELEEALAEPEVISELEGSNKTESSEESVVQTSEVEMHCMQV